MPSAGTIDWPQSPHGPARGAEPTLSFVFQEPTLLPWRTAAENVRLPLMLAGVNKQEARDRAAEALKLVGLAAFADQHPRQLSGGMKMRVSIARALVTQPKILLMDEPFAALDEITRSKLNDDLLELFARQHLTVIFVTHSVYELVFLSSRIVVMSSRPGRVAATYPSRWAIRGRRTFAPRRRTMSAADWFRLHCGWRCVRVTATHDWRSSPRAEAGSCTIRSV